jgi:hypothetical protein
MEFEKEVTMNVLSGEMVGGKNDFFKDWSLDNLLSNARVYRSLIIPA